MDFTFPVIVVAAVIFGLFVYYNGYSYIRHNPEVRENQIKVACVGDSITYGFAVSNWPQNNYPRQLQILMGDNYNVANFGVSGCSVGRKTDFPYLKTKEYLDSLKYKPDILVFMMGSNDSKSNNWTGRERFKEDYLSLLDSYVQEGTMKIYLCTVSKANFPKGRTSGMTNYGVQPKVIEEIVDIIKEVARERNYELIDINKLTADNRNFFGMDIVHLNKDGALALAEKVYEHIRTSEGE